MKRVDVDLEAFICKSFSLVQSKILLKYGCTFCSPIWCLLFEDIVLNSSASTSICTFFEGFGSLTRRYWKELEIVLLLEAFLFSGSVFWMLHFVVLRRFVCLWDSWLKIWWYCLECLLSLFYMSLCILTVPKALVISSATSTLRSGLLLLLKPFVILLLFCEELL